MSATCCEPVVPQIPAPLANAPALTALAYRIGTFAGFREAMLLAIAGEPALATLRTRNSDDYAVSLVEAWAAMADILTFYQERIANEAYLRTATLRDSVLRLVKLVDYELGRGAAAETLVAFTLDPRAQTTVPVGLRLQSVPVGQTPPQKYETLESLVADARFNRLRILPAPRPATELSDGAWVRPGPDSLAASLWAAGDRIAIATSSTFTVVRLTALAFDEDRLRLTWSPPVPAGMPAQAIFPVARAGRAFKIFGADAPLTYVLADRLKDTDPTSIEVKLYTTDFHFRPQGDATPAGDQLFLDAVYPNIPVGSHLLFAYGATVSIFRVEAVDQSNATRGPLSATITKLTVVYPDGSSPDFTGIIDIRSVALVELLGPLLTLWDSTFPPSLVTPTLYLPGTRSGWRRVTVGNAIAKGRLVPGPAIAPEDLAVGRRVLVGDASTMTSATIVASDIVADTLSLVAGADDAATITALGFGASATRQTALISPSRANITFTNPQTQVLVTIGSNAPQNIALNLAATTSYPLATVAAALQVALNAALPAVAAFAEAICVVSSDGRLIVVPGTPTDAIAFAATANDLDTVVELGLDTAQARFLDGFVSAPIGPLAAPVAGVVAASYGVGAAVDLPAISVHASPDATDVATEVAAQLSAALSTSTLGAPPAYSGVVGDRVLILPPVTTPDPPAFLLVTIAPDQPYALDAASATLLGNVALASQGETVRNEIVGDGDATVAFQRFSLRKKPLTYVIPPEGTALTSTLTLTVNGVSWTEVPTLYTAGAADQVYTTRMADDTTITITTGGHGHGAPATTGRANVAATYRQGNGLAGRVKANTLTSLLDRPPGLKSATNPLAADGGTDPESLNDARANAPNTVRTFDRAISLEDFEDLTLEGGQLAKAKGTWVWDGEQRVIHLTVAAQGGALFSADGLKRLAATLRAKRDPNHRLLIDNYQPVPIVIAASLQVDPRYDNTAVRAAAAGAALAALSFSALDFAEAVALSTIYEVLQHVEGVLAVEVSELNFKNTDPTFRALHRVDPGTRTQQRLFLLPARPQPGATALAVVPAELAVVAVPAQDLTLTASGGRTA